MLPQQGSDFERRALTLGWVLVLVLVAALTWRDYDAFQHGAYQDDAKYLQLARALVFGDSYSLTTGPGPPLRTSYPFVFPLALSAAIRLAPDVLDVGKVIALGATLVSATLLFWGWPILAPGSSRRWGLAITALVALAPATLAHARMTMSESLFIAFALAALLLVESGLRGARPRGAPHYLLLGVLLAAVAFCRYLGFALVGAVVLRLAFARPAPPRAAWRALVAGGLGVVAAVLLFTPFAAHKLVPDRALRSVRQPSTRGLGADDDPLLPRIARSAEAYGSHSLREALLPFGGGAAEARLARALGLPFLSGLVGWLVTAAVLIGAVRLVRRGGLCATALLFVVLYASILLLWPWRQARFLLPLQPFLLLALLSGVGSIAAATVLLARGRGTQARTARRAAAAAAAAALFLISLGKAVAPAQDSRLHVRDFDVEGRWLRDNAAADAVLLCEESITVHQHARRQTVEASLFASRTALAAAVDRYGIDYIVLAPAMQWRVDGKRTYDRFTERELLPFAEQLVGEGRATLVFSSDRRDLIRVYALVSGPGHPSL